MSNPILLAPIVALLLVSMGAAASLVAWCETRRDDRKQHGHDLWRTVRLRNGITAPSPWHSPTSLMNIPGLVEVTPNSLSTSPPMHEWEVTPPASVPGERPLLASVNENPCRNSVRPSSDPVNEPEEPILELTTPPASGERARVRRLYKEGVSQTAIIKRVWGLSKGGGKKYAEARKRYQDYIYDLAHYGLKWKIDQERGKHNA